MSRNLKNSDGCSGGVSALWRFTTGKNPPYQGCCRDHDEAYRAGGTKTDRLVADARLRMCIAKNGYPVAGNVMFYAVRFVGWLFFKHK